MNHLFTQTSQVLRDNWIIELQKNNVFLKKTLSNINLNPFFGYKVKIKEHAYNMGNDFIQETYGILYNINKNTIWVLYKNENNEKKLSGFHSNNVVFVDKRFEKLFE